MSEMKKARRQFAAGLLIFVTIQLVRQFVDVPDLVQGAVMGLGIGIEIRALVHMKRAKRAEREAKNSDRSHVSQT